MTGDDLVYSAGLRGVDKQNRRGYDRRIGKKGRALATDEKERLTSGSKALRRGTAGESVLSPFGGCDLTPAERLFCFACCFFTPPRRKIRSEDL